MTTAKVHRTIEAVIKGKMEKQGSRGAYLDVQVLRTGMRYPETIKCWDMKQLEHVPLNETVSLILNRDGVKADGHDDGQITSYWWSIAGVAEKEKEEIPPSPEDPYTAGSAQKSAGATTPESPPPLPQALGACQNHAMAFIESGIMPVPEGRNPISWLWELRDLVYRGVNQKPYQPGPFCYEHEVAFDRTEKSSRAAHFHVVENGYCVQGYGFVKKKD